MVRLIAFLALLPVALLGYTTTTENGVTVYLTDGSRADVQSAVTAASDGQIVNIPSGTFDWSSGVDVVGKGITIRGQGAGEIIGFSYSTEEFTMGTKDFTIYQPNSLVFLRDDDITTGETLQFHYPVPQADNSLEGTVTSYDSGTRVLTMDITTVNGAGGTEAGSDTGDEDFWVILRPATTTINVPSGSTYDAVIEMTEDDDTVGYIHSIAFDTADGTDPDEYFIEVNQGGASHSPVVVSGCTFRRDVNGISVQWNVNRGLMYDCSWHQGFWRALGTSSNQGLRVTDPDDSEWATPSRLGTLDTTGLSKLYVEDSIVFGHFDTFLDVETNGRICIRNSIIHSSKLGGHSMDTNLDNGMREFEFYNLAYLYKDDGSGRSIANENFVAPRGGTGVVHSCYVENNTSVWNSTNTAFRARFYELNRAAGEIPGPYSYGDGETSYPSVDYPIPQGVGVGYIDGSGGTFLGVSGNTRQVGEPVPVWVWNLTGDPGSYATQSYDWYLDFHGVYNNILASEWSNDGGDLLLTEASAGSRLPTADGAVTRFHPGDGTLPSNITSGALYYAIAIDIPNKKWKFSSTPGGSALAYVDSGTDNHRMNSSDSVSAHFRIDTNGDAVAEGDLVFHTTDVPLPGYEEYPYPHWLQQVTPAGASYSGRLRFNGTGAKPVRTDGVGQPIIFDQ